MLFVRFKHFINAKVYLLLRSVRVGFIHEKGWRIMAEITCLITSSHHVYQLFNTAFPLKQIYTDSKYIRIHLKTIKLKTDKYIYVSNCLH